MLQPGGVIRTLLVVTGVAGDDAALWSESLDGDGGAFGALFDLHRERVYRHALRLTANRQDAEDVTAAAFLELWRRRRDVRLVGESVLPWLLVTATNVGLNVTRGTRRYRRLLARLPRETAVSDPATDVVEQGMLGMDPQLRRSLLRLSEKDRWLVALVDIEGYPVADAASFVGMTVAAAKSRLHRARARLRNSMTGLVVSERPAETGGRR